MLTHPFTIRDGCLQIPDQPSCGSDLIAAQLLKHPAKDYPWAR